MKISGISKTPKLGEIGGESRLSVDILVSVVFSRISVTGFVTITKTYPCNMQRFFFFKL